MNASFNPVKGFKVELTYSRELISSAIAAQVAVWMNGLAYSFLGLCEATLSKGHQARTHVNHRVIQVREGVVEATTHTAVQVKDLGVELAIATGRRIQRQTQGLVLPPLNTMVERYLSVRNTVQSALTAYIEGAAGEATPLSALAQGPVMLPSGEVALEEQELLVPKYDDEATDKAIAETENKKTVDMEEKESELRTLNTERPIAQESDQEKKDTEVATSKRRGRERSDR